MTVYLTAPLSTCIRRAVRREARLTLAPGLYLSDGFPTVFVRWRHYHNRHSSFRFGLLSWWSESLQMTECQGCRFWVQLLCSMYHFPVNLALSGECFWYLGHWFTLYCVCDIIQYCMLMVALPYTACSVLLICCLLSNDGATVITECCFSQPRLSGEERSVSLRSRNILTTNSGLASMLFACQALRCVGSS